MPPRDRCCPGRSARAGAAGVDLGPGLGDGQHDQLAQLFAEGVSFADPDSPWLRPTNENTNGMLRQYSPKKTDLRTYSAYSAYSAADLAAAEDRLNHRPRKRHDWRSPAEIFASAL